MEPYSRAMGWCGNMFLFKYRFYPNTRLISASEFLDMHCESFVSELAMGGQFLAGGYFSSRGSEIAYYGACAEKTSLSPKHHFAWARRSYKRVLRYSKRRPKFELVGRLPDEKPCCTCSGKADLILTTNFLSIESVLKCTKCTRYVPLYRFRSLRYDRDLLGIDQWQLAYDRCDGLFIGSGVGERFGHFQTSSFRSPLARDGVELCRSLEKKLKVRVYYNLNTYYGRSSILERKRRCPGCNGTWLLKQPWLESYDFRCNKCRLVSNIAWDTEPAHGRNWRRLRI
jgi:predicted  nucleic acid-binding Zn ribbon protein